MPKFVFLWTDLVLWLLAAGVLLYVRHVLRSANLRATWRQVTHNAPAMCSAVVLLAFLALALLDSIHFRPKLPAVAATGAE